MLQRMANAGYAGIPTGGPNYGMVDNEQVALPQQAPLQAMAGQPPMNPAMQQAQVLRQLGQGGNATGFKTQKMPSAIPLSAVFQNANHEFNVHAEPMASGNKYRGINGEVAAPLGEGELSIQGGYGRMFGVNKSPAEIEIGARYTRGFAGGGPVDKNYGYGAEHLFFDNNRGIPTNKTSNIALTDPVVSQPVVSQPVTQKIYQPNVSQITPIEPQISYPDYNPIIVPEQQISPLQQIINQIANIKYDDQGRQLTPPGSRFQYIGAGGGGGGPAGDPNSAYETFASGGYVDGQSLVEPIGENTQAQINTLMSNLSLIHI